MTDIAVRRAGPADAPALKALIESGYRGDSARRGWNHEADILEDERIALSDLEEMLANPAIHLLMAEKDDGLIGCIAVTDKGTNDAGIHRAYFGLLCVDPTLQSSGLGTKLMQAGEDAARRFGASVMEISVIENRDVLIAWYRRKGYMETGRREPFPTPQDPPLFFRLFEKQL
ncbi:GNAT family N-acetyltransferase [Croceicoccus mobilis]|uniref:N-acetyltransferase n=1 Tax=Croceicoccus mobilis TaxID=1703339 RepID=A0A917DS16_9SPHN|nr:GNAT family N-acetyltransferase [Croceicoccus mobilis]GGD63318.1 N-acetyltransferase [Croceicoccus mobilis]